MGCSLEEKELIDGKFKALVDVFLKPTMAKLEGGGTLREHTIIERMVRLMKAESKEEIDKVNSLTDAEILAMLSNTSLKMPLNRMGFEAMKYYFKRVKGEKAYKEVFDNEPIEMFYVRQFQKRIGVD